MDKEQIGDSLRRFNLDADLKAKSRESQADRVARLRNLSGEQLVAHEYEVYTTGSRLAETLFSSPQSSGTEFGDDHRAISTSLGDFILIRHDLGPYQHFNLVADMRSNPNVDPHTYFGQAYQVAMLTRYVNPIPELVACTEDAVETFQNLVEDMGLEPSIDD